MSNEGTLVAAIRKAILAEYPTAWTFKVHGSPYQMAGVPDLLVCIDGKLLGLEVKHQKPGESREHAEGRVSPQQHFQMDAIRRAGGTAAVVMSVDESLAAIEKVLDTGA